MKEANLRKEIVKKNSESNKYIVKRGKKKHKETELIILSTNAASLKSKLKSFKSELKRSQAGIFTLQETHMSSKGKVQFDDFIIFEAIRKVKAKGGTMIGVHSALKPVLISEYNDTFEIIVVEFEAANRKFRIISGYGPQENWLPADREPFFHTLEEEIVKAEIAGKSVIIEADFNSKLGSEYITNDPHKQDKNGKLLAQIVQRQKLTVANGLVQCEGTITRKRVTTERTEESAISFVIVSEDLVDKIQSVKIDEIREHVLTRISKTKDGVKTVESDHNLIETNLKLPWNKNSKTDPEKIFNFKNIECQKDFKEVTSKNTYLSEVFEDEKDLDKATEKFLKRLDKTFHKCFWKNGQKKEKTNDQQDKLYNKWKNLRTKTDANSKAETKELEAKLAEEYYEKVMNASSEIDCEEGGMSSGKLWSLKKTLFPRCRDPPTAMINTEGNLVTNEEEIKEMALKAYEERLKNRPIKEGLEDVKTSKERLCETLLIRARNNKTPPLSIE